MYRAAVLLALFAQHVLPLTEGSSDIEGDDLTISWVGPALSGATVVINSGAKDVTYTPPVGFRGIDTFFYRLYDGQDESNTATATVTVVPRVNVPPVANAGPDRTVYIRWWRWDRDVRLDGAASTDSDGTVRAWAWDGTPDPADMPAPTVRLQRGVYTFSLVVTDEEGAESAPDTVTIIVRR